MKELIAKVDLLNRQSGEFESAELYKGIDEANLRDFEEKWRPPIAARLANLSSEAEVAASNIQDWHWDWREKAKARAGQLASESFSLSVGNTTQGLMYATTAAFARVEEQKGLDIVYVEYLATAPWNRPGFTQSPLYRGVGTILLATAISLSHDFDFQGRVGLHSLPQSESWYRNVCGMTDLGVDHNIRPAGVLRYFELTAAQAANFIA